MAIKITITPPAHPALKQFSRTSRREVLAAAGFSGLAAVAVAGFVGPESPEANRSGPRSHDAELLAMIDEFNAIGREIEAICAERIIEASRDDWEPDPPEGDAGAAKLDLFFDKRKPLFRQIISTRARTLRGVRARALMLRSWDDELAKDGASGGFYHAQMTLALTRDLAALQV